MSCITFRETVVRRVMTDFRIFHIVDQDRLELPRILHQQLTLWHGGHSIRYSPNGIDSSKRRGVDACGGREVKMSRSRIGHNSYSCSDTRQPCHVFSHHRRSDQFVEPLRLPSNSRTMRTLEGFLNKGTYLENSSTFDRKRHSVLDKGLVVSALYYLVMTVFCTNM